ncbi:hypothetical protein [Agromyces marinus]|uniref:hypothetical protein n=1 Tax=Agromyces marinus TaxID=1389020 RepID=UPI0025725AC3|nr:hypothetical protein [Agromyces marinus]
MSIGGRRALESAYATFALFTLLAGQFWRNLLGWWGSAPSRRSCWSARSGCGSRIAPT